MTAESCRTRRYGVRASAVLAFAAGLLATSAPGSWGAPPSNDMFAAADRLTGGFGTAGGTNTEATREPNEPVHAGVVGGGSVWYFWTAPQSGRVVFETRSRSTTFDTALAAYTGDRLDGLTPIAANDDARPFRPWSSITFRAVQATTYRVAVDGVAGKNGTYRLHWAMRTQNDTFAEAQRLTGIAGSVVGDNTLATRDTGEPRFRPHSIWYRWTAPSTRRMVFDTRGSEFDTVLWVFRGHDLSRLKREAVNDDALGLRSRVRFDAVAGRTYRIAISSYPRTDGDAATLNWQRWQRR